MAVSAPRAAALAAAEQRARADIRARLVQYATSVWGSLGSWRDEDIDRFVEVLVPRLVGAQLSVARLTDVYLAALTGIAPAGVSIDVTQLRGGIPPEEVYRRPSVAMRSVLAAGGTFPDALAAGTTRLKYLVRTDLQLAMTHQARQTQRGAGVQAYRRTLTGRENCGLCAVASTQRYWVSDLSPIHPGCDCGVAPLGPDEAPDQVIDADLLESVHDAVERFVGDSDRGARAPDYRELVVVREHGEYGPILTWRDDRFTSAADLAA